MKTEQELNNIKFAVFEDRKRVVNLTEKLDAARKSLYHNSIILYQFENDLNTGDTVRWEWNIDNEKYGFDGVMDEPLPEPIGEIISFSYSDYTGIQIYVKSGVNQVVLTKKDSITKI